MKHVKLAITSAFVVATAGLAHAGIAPPTGWDIQVQPEGSSAWSAAANPSTWTATPQDVGGHTRWRVQGAALGDGWNMSFDLVLDPDPFISSAFTLQNMTGITNAYMVTVSLPIFPPLSAPTTMTGSVSGTVGDGDGLLDPNGNGGTVTTFGSAPYYEALVDGAGVRSLYTAPQVHAAPLGLTNSIPTQNFINEVGPAANATIGIRNVFTLTSADNASFTNTFLIVPTPAGFAIAGLAGLAAARRRR